MKGRTLYCFFIATTIILATSFTQAQMWFPDPYPYPVTPTPATGFYLIPNEPGKSFHEARQNFLNEEAKIAAADIRKSIAYMKMEKASAKKEIRESLAESEKELEGLAQKVENETVESTRELDEAFARAHQTLAKSYIAKASDAWLKKESVQTGQYLNAAIKHFNSARAWSAQKTDAAAAAAMKDSRRIAGKLKEGAGSTAEEVGRALQETGKAIDTLGAELKRDKK